MPRRSPRPLGASLTSVLPYGLCGMSGLSVVRLEQEKVDMMVGLTDEQASKIAAHLKLAEDGPSFEAVSHMHFQGGEGGCDAVGQQGRE